MSEMADNDYYGELRESMVENQIKARGIKDERLLQAMREVPRHEFVSAPFPERAYDDTPLPIKEGQTISQPYMVAWMTDLLGLTGDETVLEIGTGSGYQAAILCKLAKFVYTVERHPALARTAAENLKKLGLSNFEVVVADGTRGLAEHAPYKGIIVTAGAPKVPRPLVSQLADGGRLVVPVGSASMQMLTVVEKKGKEIVRRREGSCVFVPLVGDHGWKRE